jgi:hypothetical protein
MRDIHRNLGIVEAIPPAVYAADNTPAAIDLLGFDAAEIAIQVGVGGISFTSTNKIDFVLTHSEDGVTYTPVTDSDVISSAAIVAGVVLSLKAPSPAPIVAKVGYIGDRRFLKLLADFAGTHATGTAIAATVIKGNARTRPVV